MGSFITGTELKVIRDETWSAWESVTIREYDQAHKEVMEREIVHMAGPPGKLPNVVMQGDLVPVLVAGIESWTFRELSQDEELRLYENQAEKLGKDVASLSTDDKCEAVKGVPTVPLTREWMGKLRPSYSTFIAREIRSLNQGRTTAQERDFLRQIGYSTSNEGEAPGGDNTD